MSGDIFWAVFLLGMCFGWLLIVCLMPWWWPWLVKAIRSGDRAKEAP